MKLIKYVVLGMLFLMPVSVFAGGSQDSTSIGQVMPGIQQYNNQNIFTLHFGSVQEWSSFNSQTNYVACPGSSKLVGGTCNFARYGDGREIQPRYCYPNGNGIYCNEGNDGYCQAIAFCS